MPNQDDDGFRKAQQLAYRCVEHVAQTLAIGTTERDACRRMRRFLDENGVRDELHRPFAWFGDRAAFENFRTPLAFFPSSRALSPGMGYILDCAPVLDGFTADVGYTGWIGENRLAERMLDDLAHHRVLIVDRVNAQRPIGEIYDAVTDLARKQGYTIRHRQYPFGVLGHRVERVTTPRGMFAGFGLSSLAAFAKLAIGGSSSLWNRSIAANKPLPAGRWAVEPHLGFRGVGAKFEEILVVDEAGARWLDDDLPHVRRWRRIAGTVAA